MGKYLDSLLKERKNVFEKKITEFNDLMADERKTRLERRKEERLEERRRKWMREREEEEQTKKDELAIKEREEREAREAIEKEKEKEEYEKKKAELEEVERKKREKEREIEERMERERKERIDNSRGGEEGVVVALVELVAAGGIERRIRKISGGQEVEMNVEEMMMVLLQGVVRHLLEEVLPLGEDLLQEGVIAEPGGEEMLLQKVLLPDVKEEEMMVLQGGVEEILVKGGVLLQGGRVTVHHQEEDLLPEEISEEMMTGEEVLHVGHLLKEELGVAVGIGLLLGEDPLLDVLLLEEALHQGVVALLPAEEAVTMDLLTGAVATVQLLLLLPLLVMNLPQQNPGQPVKNQTQAGQPSSVNPPPPGIVRAVSTLSDCPVLTS